MSGAGTTLFTYRMPAEWEPQEAVWFSWPHNRDTWPDDLDAVREDLYPAVRVISAHQRVFINVSDRKTADVIRQQSGANQANLAFFDIKTNDAWCRDHGATFVFRSDGDSTQRVAINWGYNAWGGKWPPFDLDQKVACAMAESVGNECVTVNKIIEGGALETNGAGILLTTASCVLNANRNPDLTQSEAEDLFRTYLGVRDIIWLDGEIEGDDTDGHIDNIARFVDERTVVCGAIGDPASSGATERAETLKRLRSYRTPDDQSLNVVEIPMPQTLFHNGSVLPASHLNFLITNETVLLPVFGGESDAEALSIVEHLFPNRDVIPLYCSRIVRGLGAIHCLTQQVPAIPERELP